MILPYHNTLSFNGAFRVFVHSQCGSHRSLPTIALVCSGSAAMNNNSVTFHLLESILDRPNGVKENGT